jgi:uridylate kinase
MQEDKQENEEVIVISLGGSLIIPDKIDVNFLKQFKILIENHIAQGKKFILICGGGKIAREYQDALANFVTTNDEKDWIGIHATILNAQFVKHIFLKYANEEIVTNPTETVSFEEEKSIIIAGGWMPGFSTDYDAVMLAEQFGAKRIINLSNIDYVFDSDPKINPKAQTIKELTWDAYEQLIPPAWIPGLSSPFDPVATREARRMNAEVAIIGGQRLDQIDNFLSGKDFLGTRIKNNEK